MLLQKADLTLTPWDRDHNPYLVAYVAVMKRFQEEKARWRNQGYKSDVSDEALPFLPRERLIDQYAFAVPSEGALRTIMRWSPNGVLEVGAGAGYWAKLMTELGIDVIACDSLTSIYRSSDKVARRLMPTHFPVMKMSGVQALHRFGHDRTMLLCWPDMKKWPARTLTAYRGQSVIYVGEADFGRTADRAFREILEEHWTLKEECTLPQWVGVCDYLMVYERA